MAGSSSRPLVIRTAAAMGSATNQPINGIPWSPGPPMSVPHRDPSLDQPASDVLGVDPEPGTNLAKRHVAAVRLRGTVDLLGVEPGCTGAPANIPALLTVSLPNCAANSPTPAPAW